MKIILEGNAKSKQTIYFSACRGKHAMIYMSKKGKDLKSQYIRETEEQYNGELLTEDLILEIKYYFSTKHRRDIDNYAKLVLDAMEGIVYEDDTQIQDLIQSKYYDKENPRIEIRKVKNYKIEYDKE